MDFFSQMKGFTWIDMLILVVYMIAVLFAGLYFSKKEMKGKEFFKGDGSVPWWVTSVSIFATLLSPISFLALAGNSYAGSWMLWFAQIGMIIQPLFTPLGFGSQLGSFGWVFAVGAITGLIAKENVIATFAMLGAVVANVIDPSTLPGSLELYEGASDVALMIQATGINIPGIIAFIVFNMTTIPCFAAVATAKAELKKGTLKNTIAFWLITSYIAASAFYLIGTWWWTLFIYLALAAGVIVFIYFYNKKHPIKPQGAVTL